MSSPDVPHIRSAAQLRTLTAAEAPRLTGFVILGVVAGLAAYDFWVGLKYGGEATESWLMATLARKYPSISFGMGYLMGHFFAQMNLPDR